MMDEGTDINETISSAAETETEAGAAEGEAKKGGYLILFLPHYL
jgi:hypothetical protein